MDVLTDHKAFADAAEAEALAAHLNEDADGWTYRAERDWDLAPGKTLVVAYDEEGVRLGAL